MSAPQVFTREALLHALRPKVLPRHQPDIAVQGAGWIADAIRAHGLESVIAGRHDGKPVTFARGFEIVFGERLK